MKPRGGLRGAFPQYSGAPGGALPCFGEQGPPPGEAGHRRPTRSSTRESRCPIRGCRFRTRKIKVHFSGTHLHPLYLREVPCAPEITRARKAVLDCLSLRLLGPGTSLLEMSARVPAGEVFTSPADIPDDVQEAIDALCLEVREEPPSTYALEGDLHPALLLHWQVQAYLVGHLDPDSRQEYRALLPGLRDLVPMATGPLRVHLSLMYEWYVAGLPFGHPTVILRPGLSLNYA